MNGTTEVLIDELRNLDSALVEADARMRLARVQYELAAEKYQAVRDLVISRLDTDPYIELIEGEMIEFESKGRYRYRGFTAGEAALAVLKEAKGEALSLSDIAVRMNKAGAGFVPRMINAALMQMKNVDKPEEGKYRIIDTDDLPFEV